jgi:hypothetical protein
MMPLRCALAVVALSACGNASTPLISGAVTGTFKGTAFQAVTGFAKNVPNKGSLIGLGSGQLNCGSADSPNPPLGLTGIISLSAFAVGQYSGITVTVLQGSPLDAYGSNNGAVTLSSVTTSSVAGTVAYSDVDPSNGNAVNLTGSFEVVFCP